MNQIVKLSLQIVEGKLFTGSHDGILKLWDITGIKDDSISKKDNEPSKMTSEQKKSDLDGNQNIENCTRIIIDEDEGKVQGLTNGGCSHNPDLLKNESQVY